MRNGHAAEDLSSKRYPPDLMARYSILYAEDLAEIQKRQDEIWELQREMLRRLACVLEAVK